MIMSLQDFLMVAIIITNVWILASSRLLLCIRVASLQGILIGIVPLVVSTSGELSMQIIIISIVVIILKGIVFPLLLRWTLISVGTSREVEPLVGYHLSIIISVGILMISFWLSSKLPLEGIVSNGLFVPISLATIISGLFLIISRIKALTQVLGYLVMENGIYLFSVSLLAEQPFVIEMGILLDLFVAVFVMGIAIFHISREFDHIDTNMLNNLSENITENAGE